MPTTPQEPRQVRYCYECGHKVDASRPSCWYCGTETRRTVRPAPKCVFCGSEIPAGALKCRHCGEWLDGRPREAAPPSQVVFVVDRTLLGAGGDLQLLAGRPVPPDIANRLDARTVRAIEQGRPELVEERGVRALPAPAGANEIIDLEPQPPTEPQRGLVRRTPERPAGGPLARRENLPEARRAPEQTALTRGEPALPPRRGKAPAADDALDVEGGDHYRICETCATEILASDNYCYHCRHKYRQSQMELHIERRRSLRDNRLLYYAAAALIAVTAAAPHLLPLLPPGLIGVEPGLLRLGAAAGAMLLALLGLLRRRGILSRMLAVALIIAAAAAWLYV